MSLTVIFSIIFIHWVADFVLQTDKQAKGKSKNWSDLLSHTGTYSLVWLLAGLIYLGYTFIDNEIQPTSNLIPIILFPLITFICHTITDYFTSKLNSRLWNEATFWQNSFNKEKYGEAYCSKMSGKYTHNFFVSVGFDQVLHYLQLFLTFYFLTK
jgi:hypothetical protein